AGDVSRNLDDESEGDQLANCRQCNVASPRPVRVRQSGAQECLGARDTYRHGKRSVIQVRMQLCMLSVGAPGSQLLGRLSCAITSPYTWHEIGGDAADSARPPWRCSCEESTI